MDIEKSIFTQIKKLFEANPDVFLTVKELSQATGCNANSIRSCLRREESAFTSRQRDASGKGKPALEYNYKTVNAGLSQPGIPMTGDEIDFIKNPQVCALLQNLLEGDKVPAAFVTGPVQCGKTSMVNWLIKKARLIHHYLVLPIDFSMSRELNDNTSLESFFEKFFGQIGQDFLNETDNKERRNDIFKRAWDLMEKIIDDYLGQEPKGYVLLTIDGLDTMTINNNNPALLDDILRWLASLRTKMSRSPFDRLKLLSSIGLPSFSSAYSKLLVQNRRVPMEPFSPKQIGRLITCYQPKVKMGKDQLAATLHDIFQGQAFLTHMAITMMMEKNVDPSYFSQSEFLNHSDVKYHWKRIKKTLKITLMMLGYENDELLLLFQAIRDHKDDNKTLNNLQKSLLNSLWNYLLFSQIINVHGEINSPIYEELILRELTSND